MHIDFPRYPIKQIYNNAGELPKQLANYLERQENLKQNEWRKLMLLTDFQNFFFNLTEIISINQSDKDTYLLDSNIWLQLLKTDAKFLCLLHVAIGKELLF